MTYYYCLTRTADDVILDVREDNPSWYGSGIEDTEIRVKDLVSPPLMQGTLTAGGTYTPPVLPYLKGTWSGNGTLTGGHYEMTSDGVNVATLSLQKTDRSDESAINSGSEVYYVCVEGSAAVPDSGKVTLVNGAATLNFTPSASSKGTVSVMLLPSGHTVLMDAVEYLSLI